MVRKIVARPMPSRRARAPSTRSALVKCPGWSATRWATARRGPVNRNPAPSRAVMKGAASVTVRSLAHS